MQIPLRSLQVYERKGLVSAKFFEWNLYLTGLTGIQSTGTNQWVHARIKCSKPMTNAQNWSWVCNCGQLFLSDFKASEQFHSAYRLKETVLKRQWVSEFVAKRKVYSIESNLLETKLRTGANCEPRWRGQEPPGVCSEDTGYRGAFQKVD